LLCGILQILPAGNRGEKNNNIKKPLSTLESHCRIYDDETAGGVRMHVVGNNTQYI